MGLLTCQQACQSHIVWNPSFFIYGNLILLPEVQQEIATLQNKLHREDKVCLFFRGSKLEDISPWNSPDSFLKITLLTETSLNYKTYPQRYFGQAGT